MAVAREGDQAAFLDVQGNLSIRSLTQGSRLTATASFPGADVVALSAGWLAVGGGGDDRPAWLDLRNLEGATEPLARVLLDSRPVNLKFAAESDLIVARTCGLLRLTCRPHPDGFSGPVRD